MRSRVLVVEDDPTLRKLVRQSLERLGVEVVDAGDGREAITLLEASRFDVVCLDLMLPVVSGYQVCQHIQSTPALAEIPVVVMSARSLPEDRARAFELGAHAYLVKPFAQAELRSTVQDLIAGLGAPAPIATNKLAGVTS